MRYRELDSTSDEAKRLITQGAGEGTVIRAATQTHGRGKPGRRWFSPPQVGLYFSLILQPYKNPADLKPLTGLGAEAVVKALAAAADLPAKIKLPNDVLLNGRKVCGILTERVAAGYVIMGFGVNVNNAAGSFPDDLSKTATSLLIETGRVQDAEKFLSLLLAKLDQAYLAYLGKIC